MTSRYLALITALLLVSGCARLTLMTSQDVASEIQQASEQQDFNSAWYYLDNIRESSPQFSQVSALRSKLEKDTQAFEQKNIQKARSLASSGRWPEAFAVLEQAQKKWRKSDALASAQQALTQREALLFNRLRTDLLVDEATWLASKRNTIEQLGTLNRADARSTSEKLEQRRKELVTTLTELGNDFAKQEDWPRTRDLLTAAQKLSGSKETPAALAQAHKYLSRQANRDRKAREQKVQSQALKLLDTYDKSRSLADLLKARDYISSNNSSGQLDQYASRLEAICQQRFKQGLSDGEALYAQGRYKDAYQAWENVSRIYPDDVELTKKMERARKVLDNLKALSDS